MEEHPTFADGGSGTVRVAAPPKPRRHGPGQPPGWFRAEADALGCASCRTARHPGPPRVARKEQSCRTSLTLLRHFLQSSEDPGGVPWPEARYADQRTESRI